MLLSVNDIYKSFGEKQVLKGVSLSAESGKALGILGRNGAGKTTLIRIIMQVFTADSGFVCVDNIPISEAQLNIGYLPEERGLYPKKKIINQLVYFAGLKGVDKNTAEKTADYYLGKLEISQYKNSRLDTLSKGNQQKVQLIAALISDPDIIVLDEPFSGLDPVNAGILKDLVRELISNGRLVLFSSHQMNYIEEFCNDIVILNGGHIVADGTIKEIKHQFARNIVEINCDEPGKLSVKLDSMNLPCIRSINETDSALLVTIDCEESKYDLMSAVAQSGENVDGIQVKEPNLNDIFVHFTEGQI
ncbi:MAG: ATP-binding cassette domain-containing protein [Clostridiales bacterium]|nr:ATP-binding cassette domain-containing protein [Clostridiales bacterium]